jgi:hypothetical protein
VVVAEDVPIGTVLTEDKIASREVPQAYLEERNGTSRGWSR